MGSNKLLAKLNSKLEGVQLLKLKRDLVIILNKVVFRYIRRRGVIPSSFLRNVVDETPDSTYRAPGRVAASARFPLQLMWAQLATKAESLKKHRVIEESYRSAARAVGHVALLQFENSRFLPTVTV